MKERQKRFSESELPEVNRRAGVLATAKGTFAKQRRKNPQPSPIVGDEVGDGRARAVSHAGGFKGVGTDAIAGHERALSAVARAVLHADSGGVGVKCRKYSAYNKQQRRGAIVSKQRIRTAVDKERQ